MQETRNPARHFWIRGRDIAHFMSIPARRSLPELALPLVIALNRIPQARGSCRPGTCDGNALGRGSRIAG